MNYFVVYADGNYDYCEYSCKDTDSFCEHVENIIGDYARFTPIKDSDSLYWGINEMTPKEDNPKVIVKANCGQAYQNEEFDWMTDSDIIFVKDLVNNEDS